MASVPYLLFLSLLCHSIILAKCQVDDGKLLSDMNKYRSFLNLTTPLKRTESADCVADVILGTFTNQSCSSTVRNTTTTLSNYTISVAKCGINASGDGLILAACGPSGLFALDAYAITLNSTGFSDVGIGSGGNWTVVVLLSNGLVNGASTALAFTALGPVHLVLSFLCFLVLL